MHINQQFSDTEVQFVQGKQKFKDKNMLDSQLSKTDSKQLDLFLQEQLQAVEKADFPPVHTVYYFLLQFEEGDISHCSTVYEHYLTATQ